MSSLKTAFFAGGQQKPSNYLFQTRRISGNIQVGVYRYNGSDFEEFQIINSPIVTVDSTMETGVSNDGLAIFVAYQSSHPALLRKIAVFYRNSTSELFNINPYIVGNNFSRDVNLKGIQTTDTHVYALTNEGANNSLYKGTLKPGSFPPVSAPWTTVPNTGRPKGVLSASPSYVTMLHGLSDGSFVVRDSADNTIYTRTPTSTTDFFENTDDILVYAERGDTAGDIPPVRIPSVRAIPSGASRISGLHQFLLNPATSERTESVLIARDGAHFLLLTKERTFDSDSAPFEHKLRFYVRQPNGFYTTTSSVVVGSSSSSLFEGSVMSDDGSLVVLHRPGGPAYFSIEGNTLTSISPTGIPSSSLGVFTLKTF